MEHFDYTNSAEKKLVTLAATNKAPIMGTMELLPLCNMSCDMCYVKMSRAQVDSAGGLKPVSYWIDLGKQMQKAGVLFLLLTGGEPLLYPGFKELYLELKNMGMILTVNTNGTLLDESWAHFFGDHMPRRINVTLYGKNEAAYSELCHYKEGYHRAMNAIKLLKKYGVSVKINGSVTSVNLQDMNDIYQIGEALDAPVHMDTYMIPCVSNTGGQSQKNKSVFDERESFAKISIATKQDVLTRLSPQKAAEAEILAKKKELSQEAFTAYCKQMIDQVENYDGSISTGVRCLAGRCSFAVDWRGQMRPCVSMLQPSANVFEQGFMSAWKDISDKVQSLHINKKCSACNLMPVCQVCVASAYLETGEYDGVPDYLCEYSRAYYKQLVTFS